jgi:hypothetical protein
MRVLVSATNPQSRGFFVVIHWELPSLEAYYDQFVAFRPGTLPLARIVTDVITRRCRNNFHQGEAGASGSDIRPTG